MVLTPSTPTRLSDRGTFALTPVAQNPCMLSAQSSNILPLRFEPGGLSFGPPPSATCTVMHPHRPLPHVHHPLPHAHACAHRPLPHALTYIIHRPLPQALTSSIAHCHMPSLRKARAVRDAVAHCPLPAPATNGAPPAAAAAAVTAPVGLPFASRSAAGAPAMAVVGLGRAEERGGGIWH